MNLPLSVRPGPLSPGRTFARLRWAMLRNSMRGLLGSPIRPVTILLCSIFVWIFVFGISYGGFIFLRQQGLELSGGIVSLLFDLLFAALAALLIFSSGIILYSSLFNAAETSFLLSLPVSADQVYAYKFQGALSFSSWAFILLGGPILIAYGVVYAAPWHFYVLLPVFFFGFVLIPGSLGALLCLLIVNYLPRRKKTVLLLAVIVLAVPVSFWVYRTMLGMRYETLGRDGVERLLGRFRVAESPLIPSHWVSQGLRAAARNEPGRAGYYLALVWSNGLMCFLGTAWLSRGLYRRGLNRLSTGEATRRRYGTHWLDSLLSRLLFFVDSQTRWLIIKDWRTFRRDPAQWAQVVIFSALMTLYFVNVRRLFIQDISWTFQNALSVLNFSAIALLLCTYTGRFIYPMLSLEGRKFWILGLLPLQRSRLLWGKFVFSATGAILIATTLVLVSDAMLEMPLLAILLHLLGVVVLAAGLSGLSVGLGACMPNFRETDPSKIAVGFGGTLNLVVGLFFLLLVILLLIAPWHVAAGLAEGPPTSPLALSLIAGCALLGIAVGAAAVILPLYYGVQNLRRMEF